jgi:DNA-binding response OmpR family regulator
MGGTGVKVMLVDDDADLLDVTAYALRREGFTVLLAQDGDQAIRRWRSDAPDVVVLDIGLPSIDGLQVCRMMRQRLDTPIIFLSAHSDEEQIVQGFRAGADDYVTKPFSPRQLAARIRAVARRASRSTEPDQLDDLLVGDVRVEAESHEVRRGDEAIRLTPTEFRLLYILASNPGRVVSSARLLAYAWGYDADDTSLLKTHVSHLRKKLAPLLGDGTLDIEALPRVGYRLAWQPSPAATDPPGLA